MEKTKLGISVGMFGALCYFAGFMGWQALVIISGYVLLFESNEWLKKSAVKAAAIVVGFTVLLEIISAGGEIFSVLNQLSAWLKMELVLSDNYSIMTFVRNILYALRSILLLVLGSKAFKQGSVKVPVIDPVIEKHM